MEDIKKENLNVATVVEVKTEVVVEEAPKKRDRASEYIDDLYSMIYTSKYYPTRR